MNHGVDRANVGADGVDDGLGRIEAGADEVTVAEEDGLNADQ